MNAYLKFFIHLCYFDQSMSKVMLMWFIRVIVIDYAFFTSSLFSKKLSFNAMKLFCE